MNVQFLDRPPRIQPELPAGEHTIPSPPEKREKRQALQYLILPFVALFGYLLMAAGGQGRNPLLMIPMALSTVLSSIFAIFAMRQEAREHQALVAAYAKRLTDLRREMEASHEMQRTFYWYNYPDPNKVLRFASGEEESRSGPRLWERRPTDPDFGAIRLGVGTLPSTVIYKVSEGKNTEDPQMRDAERLAEDSHFVADVPIIIPLKPRREEAKSAEQGKEGEKKEKAKPIRHSIGVVGNNVAKTSDFVRALVAHFVAYHSPLDARLHVVGTPQARDRWEWAVWLPHANSRSESYLGDQMSFDPQAVHASWEAIAKDLDKRQLRMQDQKDLDVTIPFNLVVVDMQDELEEGSPLREVAAEAAVSMILKRGQGLGAAILFLVSDPTQIPSECQGVIEVEPIGNKVAFRYAEVDLNTPRYIGTADTLDSVRAEKQLSQRVKDFTVRKSFGEDIATYVSFLDLFGHSRVENLPISESWSKSRSPEGAEWLRVPLGLMGANKIGGLAFSADEDGVHGMIAGTTGSGKSELLLTLVAGLAIKYDPTVLNFVLVDYKGGAAFEPFRELPHVVDIASNLEGNAVERMFIAIKAELDRRSAILKDTNVKHVVEYRKKGYHLKAPFPHLFIIVDEFAEMVAENSEYKARFDSITRLGRAIGVSLILATQRPTGAVTDQMRANMKFRICLRVETSDDSRELLKRSDAAFLPSNVPGRAYVQVGSDQLNLMQVARAGGGYSIERPVVLDDFIWLEDEVIPVASGDGRGAAGGDGASAAAAGTVQVAALPFSTEEIADALGGQAPETLVDWVVGYTALLAQREAVPKQIKPWPDPLPVRLALNLPIDAKHINTARPHDGRLVLSPSVAQWSQETPTWEPVNWRSAPLRVDIGIVDNPYASEQRILTMDLTRGPIVLFGAPGWGKSTFFRTLMLALAASHSPADLQMYALDFGKGGLNAIQALPHLGASVDSTEEGRVERLMRMLANLLDSRRKIVMQYGSLLAYNAENPDTRLPAVLTVVDNFAEFKENYENHLPMFMSLVRDGRAFGLYFAVTASQVNDLPGKLYNLFTERMSLKLPDPTEYTGIVGRGAPRFNDVQGRGVVSVERTPLEFQIAIPMQPQAKPEAISLDEGSLYEEIAQAMSAAWTGVLPEPVEVLPEVILLKDLLSKMPDRPATLQAIVGLNDLDRRPTAIDLEKLGPHFMVVGPPLSGKTNCLRTTVISLADIYEPGQLGLVLIDPKKGLFSYGGKHTLSDLPHVLCSVSEIEEFDELLLRLKSEYDAGFIKELRGRSKKDYVEQRRRIVALIDNYDEIGSITGHSHVPQLGEYARKYGSEGLHFVLGGSLGILRSRDELIKQVDSPRYSLVVQDAETVRTLGGKIPYGSGKAELPPGRGFVVKSIRTSLTQVAMSYEEAGEGLERGLDEWVERIAKKHGKARARWSYRGSFDEPEEKASGGQSAVTPVVPEIEMDPEVEEEYRRQLKEMGIELPKK